MTGMNREELSFLLVTIRQKAHPVAKLLNKACVLRKAHREHYFDEYKPIGWEVLDIRHSCKAPKFNLYIISVI